MPLNPFEQALENRLANARAEELRKNLTISLPVNQIDMLDRIARTLSMRGDSTARNDLLNEAISIYIKEVTKALDNRGIELVELENVSALPAAPSFDTIVFPAADNADYRKAFFEDQEWRFVRINRENIPHVRHIALYVGRPQSAITHYAEVAPDGFVFDEEQGKYRVKLAGAPQPLDNPVRLGTAKPAAARSSRYTTLEKLKSARDYNDL